MNDERAIRDLVSEWMAATKRGDKAAVLALMTDDVVFLGAGHAPFGKDVFAVSFDAMKGIAIDGSSEVVEIQVSGDMAFARCTLAVTATMPDGKVIVREGPGLSVYRKEGGRWRLSRDANMMTMKASVSDA